MKNKFYIIVLSLIIALPGYSQNLSAEQLFDDGWKFHKGDIEGAEKSSFNDKSWREVDLPHDWSIEKLPGQEPGKVVGPFHKDSPGTTATAYTLGGTGWYRKTFTLEPHEELNHTIIHFDGVYMNSEVWVNGKKAGVYPSGYSAFYFDISKYLKPAGTPNVIAVKVSNEGKTSRWYSGSGIYRHVWMIRKQDVHVAHNGLCVTTESISTNEARIRIASTLKNLSKNSSDTKLLITVYDPSAKAVKKVETQVKSISAGSSDFIQDITIPEPTLWSVDTPNLYKAEVEVVANGVITDKVDVTFGIRTLKYSASEGFLINGKSILMKGGCLHHDNGFLGSATIDRAEERRVELMKAYGYNAIRTAHNLPSKQFLDACDRNGMLVIDEIFDMWERPKNPQDHHLFFKEWWEKDIESMIMRDRNHPSVIMWSIGNEINERAEEAGFAIRKKLVAKVKSLDSTRPVTEGICSFWDHPGQQWSTTAEAFADLDIGGYNYFWKEYEADHALYPDRIMMGTESYAREAYDNWKQVEKNSWVIGDFVWTAMDYLGETGVGHSRLDDDPDRIFLRSWPWYNGYCGDIDLCGLKKPQMLYKDIVWGNSKLEMAVHTPIPEGRKEIISYWGWPNEVQSWNWEGFEGQLMDVRVFSSYPTVRIELNGKIIDEQPAGDDTKYIANFKVPYESGVLRAVALENGIVVASKELRTTGRPAKIKLTADRSTIKPNRNDLSYVKVEITDAQGNLIPGANIPMTLTVSGDGEIAGSGNSSPSDQESFNSPVCKTYNGCALVILRPLKNERTGSIHLKVKANGLTEGEIDINIQ